MTELQSLVTPGQQTILSPVLAAGSTIFNKSATDAVWVSGTPNPSPGIGYKVGGYGSIQWQNTGPAYACVDTGVLNTVSLSVSDHVGSPVNPVDVATATANAINSKGIPNVLLGSLVYNGPLGVGVPYNNGHLYTLQPLDFSAYASVTIFLFPSNACQVKIFWQEASTQTTFSNPSYEFSGYQPNGRGIWITQTVKAPLLTIWLGGSNGGSIQVYATNRILPEGMAGWDTGIITNIPTTAFTADQQVSFPDSYMSKGGIHTLRVASAFPSTVCKGYFGYAAYDNGALPTTRFIAHTGQAISGPNSEVEILQQVCLPPGLLQLVWKNSSTANTYGIGATLTMGAA